MLPRQPEAAAGPEPASRDPQPAGPARAQDRQAPYVGRYRENYDTIARDHLDHLDRTGRNPFMNPAAKSSAEDCTLALACAYVSPGMRVMDAGCGPGDLLARLQETCGPIEGHGVDISEAYLKRVRREIAHPVQAMLERLPFPEQCFDAVIATDVLEHVFDLYSVSAELVRVLKPGGTLIARVPNEEALDSYLEQSDYAFVHLRSFSPAALRLHFEVIFDLEYESVRFSEPVYKGAQTLKSRPLAREDADALFALLAPYEHAVKGAGELLHATRQDAGVFHAALNRLSIRAPELYRQAVAILARPLEMAMAFRKP